MRSGSTLPRTSPAAPRPKPEASPCPQRTALFAPGANAPNSTPCSKTGGFWRDRNRPHPSPSRSPRTPSRRPTDDAARWPGRSHLLFALSLFGGTATRPLNGCGNAGDRTRDIYQAAAGHRRRHPQRGRHADARGEHDQRQHPPATSAAAHREVGTQPGAGRVGRPPRLGMRPGSASAADGTRSAPTSSSAATSQGQRSANA